jgi:hypothetical protein
MGDEQKFYEQIKNPVHNERGFLYHLPGGLHSPDLIYGEQLILFGSFKIQHHFHVIQTARGAYQFVALIPQLLQHGADVR